MVDRLNCLSREFAAYGELQKRIPMSKKLQPFFGPSLCGILTFANFIFGGCEPKATHEAPGHFPDRDLARPNAANEGVVLAWPEGTLPTPNTGNNVSVGQTLIVRVRNLDGWLIRKLAEGHITGEPAMSPKQKKNYLLYQNLLYSLKYKDSEKSTFLQNVIAGGEVAVPSMVGFPVNDVTFHDLLDARIAYNTLVNVIKRSLFLVINNSQFRQIKAENPDALNLTNKEVVKEEGDTLHELEFRVRRRPGDEEAWGNLYDGTRAVHDVRVSLGVELDKNVYVLDTAVFPQAEAMVQRVRLELFQSGWLWSVLAGLGLLLILGIFLSVKTPLLRDMDLPLRADGCPQFSLSRLQLAFWTYLAVGAFLIIWLVTDRLDTLNTTILALLGISSGTTLASKLANSLTLEGGATRAEPERAARRSKSTAVLRKELGDELNKLETEAIELERTGDAAPTDGAELEPGGLSARIQRLHDDLDYLNQHRITRFCIDLLAENGRVALHRLQVLIWTAVLGVVFIAKVKRELSMPVFSETLLGLMGLSSATYIALKIPELKKTQADVNAAAKEERK